MKRNGLTLEQARNELNILKIKLSDINNSETRDQKQYQDLDTESSQLLRSLIHSSLEGTNILPEIFVYLGDIKFFQSQLAIESQRMHLYNQAAIRYLYVVKLYEAGDKTSEENIINLSKVTEKIINLHNRITMRTYSEGLDSSSLSIDSLSHKYQLTDLREAIHKRLVDSGESIEIGSPKRIFEDITTIMKSYLRDLYIDSESIFGEPPCKYAVIGLGSMALKSITPYSDLEFAIITENDEYKTSDDSRIREYFTNLSYYVHFKVILLGETIIPASDYNIDTRHLIKRGVNFDLGGKTPLGRGDKPYSLIQTIDGMMYYLENRESRIEHIDKLLPYILQTVTYVYGATELVDIYSEKVKNFLSNSVESGQLISAQRAIKALLDGSVEHAYLGNKSIKKTEGNLLQLEVSQHSAAEFGKLYDVKQEIYRLPDRLLYNMSLICGIYSNESNGISMWEVVELMLSSGIISRDAANNLYKMLDYSYILRLKIYDYYQEQKEIIDISASIIDDAESNSKTFSLDRHELLDTGKLFEYYYSALSLLDTLNSYCMDKKVGTEFFREKIFYDNSSGNKFIICQRLSLYEQTFKFGLEHLSTLTSTVSSSQNEIAAILNNLSIIAAILSKHEEALNYALQAKEIEISLGKDNTYEIAIMYNNIGMALGSLGRHDEALINKKHALAILLSLDIRHDDDIATIYNNIGVSYEDLGEYSEALDNKLQALSIRQRIYGEEAIDIANSYDSLGSIYSKLGDHAKALEFKEKSLELQIKLLGEYHHVVAIGYNNVGMIYGDIGNYNKELEYKFIALNILLSIFGEKNTDVASCYNNIGSTYTNMQDYDNALKYTKLGIDLSRDLLGIDHPDLAVQYTNLGTLEAMMGLYEEAMADHNTALNIAFKAPTQRSSEIAAIYNNIAYTFSEIGDFDNAIMHYQKALPLFIKLYGEESEDVALVYNNIGTVCIEMGDASRAWENIEKAESIWVKLNNPQRIISLEKNLAMSYHQSGDNINAISHLLNAIRILESLGREDTTLSSTYTTLGAIYNLEKDYTNAMFALRKALEIDISLEGQKSELVATDFHNISNCARNAQNYELAKSFLATALSIRLELFGETDSVTQSTAHEMLTLIGLDTAEPS